MLTLAGVTATSIPGAPTIGTATATGKTTATVSYTAPASDGGSPILSYTAVSSPAGGTGTLNQAGSGTINVTGLTAATSYTFTVRATNAIGQGPASAASNSITTDAIAFATRTNIGGTSQVQEIKNDSNGNLFHLTSYSDGSGVGQILLKFNSVGDVQWTIRTTNFGSGPTSFAIDSSNNIYIAVATGTQVRILKVANSDGSVLAQTAFTAPTGCCVGAFFDPNITIDSSNNIILVCRGNAAFSNAGFTFVVKLNTSLSQIWQRNVQGGRVVAGGEPSTGVITDSSNNIFIGGGIDSGGFRRPIITKLNSSGSFEWGKILRGDNCAFPQPDGNFNSVAVDPSGNVYAVGRFQQLILIVKYDTSGTLQWQRAIFDANMYGWDIVVDSSGNSYIAGNNTNNTALMAKYNSSGTIQWQRRVTYPSRNTDGNRITLAPSGNVQFGVTSNTGTYFQVVLNVPNDGSRTGTFTLLGNTGTYATSSFSEGATSAEVINGGGSAAISVTQSTPEGATQTSGYSTATGDIV